MNYTDRKLKSPDCREGVEADEQVGQVLEVLVRDEDGA